MTFPLPRRRFLWTVSAASVAAWAGRAPAGENRPEQSGESPTDGPGLPDGFPRQDPVRVRETVAVSHGNLERVRELLGKTPALAKAAWDWGYGDWESALGAASHTGNREIAEFLIEHGARPTLFSAAMLGQLDVVRAFASASPGIQSTPGPHGIPLLSHARAGGEPALPVLAYLESLGDADIRPAQLSGPEQLGIYLGSYAFGVGERDRFEVIDRRGSLMIQRAGGTARGLSVVGEHAFHPAGAAAVRIRFRVNGKHAEDVTVQDGDLVLTARRVALPG